jgi:hypothetical protein
VTHRNPELCACDANAARGFSTTAWAGRSSYVTFKCQVRQIGPFLLSGRVCDQAYSEAQMTFEGSVDSLSSRADKCCEGVPPIRLFRHRLCLATLRILKNESIGPAFGRDDPANVPLPQTGPFHVHDVKTGLSIWPKFPPLLIKSVYATGLARNRFDVLLFNPLSLSSDKTQLTLHIPPSLLRSPT